MQAKLFALIFFSVFNALAFANAHLLFGGDIMAHTPISADALAAKSYEHQFSAILPAIKRADYFVANLETPIAKGNYSGYPRFNAPKLLAKSLKDIGVNLVQTANNHSLDQGLAGVYSTLDALDEQGILHVGSARSKAEQNELKIVQIGEFKVAFLAYTYGLNGLKLTKPEAINVFINERTYQPEYDRLKADLARAKASNVDLIAVLMHWGVEYTHKPTSQQLKMAEFLIDNGADLILGSHPHVLQPFRRIKTAHNEGWVIYSAGNLLSNQVAKISTRTTALFDIELARDEAGKALVKQINYEPFMMMKDTSKALGSRMYLLNIKNSLNSQDIKASTKTLLKEGLNLAQKVLGE